jgi:hypothetical protein
MPRNAVVFTWSRSVIDSSFVIVSADTFSAVNRSLIVAISCNRKSKQQGSGGKRMSMIGLALL